MGTIAVQIEAACMSLWPFIVWKILFDSFGHPQNNGSAMGTDWAATKPTRQAQQQQPAQAEPGIHNHHHRPPLLVGFFFDFDDSSTNSFDFSQRNSFRVDPIPETAMPRCTTVELGAWSCRTNKIRVSLEKIWPEKQLQSIHFVLTFDFSAAVPQASLSKCPKYFVIYTYTH